ncbi:ABC transporter permease subunit [Fictibacillus sp. 7GRE50]|uniref:ABC transporter permease n=1 Tax=Fictibacillus sp. 7GRE50 TaxID=2745878 RepID=UPI0018CFA270|nr:ABC transporter permease subunit [Fictibacillus sp. 7GRE50]MBH0164729.1 ABC transporter permease subunit [Fictibacillus sp. 7GRE50]
MSLPLFLAMMKSHGKLIAGFIYGAAAYIVLIIWIYPSIADMKGFNDMIAALPEGMRKLIGMENGINSLSDYVAGEFYGMLFLIILMVYVILTSTRVMARLIDQGSMAYMLATPNSRVKVAITQAVVLLTGLALIVGFTTLSGIAASEWLIQGYQLDIPSFIRMNVLTFLIFSTIAGYCFFISSVSNDEKKALGISAGITLLFYMLNMAGKLSEKTEWMLNFSIFKWYDPVKLINNETDAIWIGCSLSISTFLLFMVSVIVFKNRNLPL